MWQGILHLSQIFLSLKLLQLNCSMHRQESVKESWPVASYPLVPEACKLKILMACRHHIMGLKCPLQEESLSSLQLSFPGQFVQVQYVIGLVSDGTQELLECRLEPTGNGNAQFKVVHNARCRHIYNIEAEVDPQPPNPKCLVQTSSVECIGTVSLPSHAGKFTFLLPADIPSTFYINFKFKSVGSVHHCDGGLIDEIKTYVVTHYAPKSLCDYWDGHSLPEITLPLARRQLVGILQTPEAQRIIQYFQYLVENGASNRFKLDQDRLLQHTSAAEVCFKDLVLAVQLEESLLLYQMGNLEGCKQLCEDVCTQADKFNSPNYNALAVKAKSVKSGAYKQEKDFSKAEEALEAGTELLEGVVPGEETAVNRTCVAALFSEKASVTGITESEKQKMKKAMQDALVHYRHQIDQNLSRNARSPRRSLIRSIFYYLHSSRVKATDLQIPISDKRLKKVESFIQQFRRDFLGDCPMRDKALFFSALGDLFTRKGEYEEGISVVSEALRIAEDLQLNEDVIGVRVRLQQLYLLRQQGEENGRIPLEIPEGRMVRSQPFQEPRYEILQGYLEQLTRVSRSRS